jgi:transposase
MDDLPPKPNRTSADKDARRKLAIRKVLDVRTPADVADFLGVHTVTVAKWVKAYRDGGGRRWRPSRCPAAPLPRV